MLIASSSLYLLVTIAIGLWAAQRVHNSKDYVVAGRSLPLYMHGDGVRDLVRLRDRASVSATFVKDGLGGVVADPFGSSFCLILVGAVLRARVLPHGPAHDRRLLPQALQQPVEVDHQRRDHRLLPRLDLGADHRARPGVLGALRRRDLA